MSNLKNTKNCQYRTDYKEEPDAKSIAYLNSLTKQELIMMNDKCISTITADYTKSSKIDYINRLINYVRFSSKVKGAITQHYSHDGTGRLYASEMGFQNLSRELRGLVARDNHIDVDMKNALPTLMLHFSRASKEPHPRHNLEHFVSNRASFLEKHQITKQTVISTVFMIDNPSTVITYNGEVNELNELIKEVKNIKGALYRTYKDDFPPNPKSKNPISSVVSKLIFNEENIILNKVMDTLPKKAVVTPVFDGFIAKKEFSEKLNIEKINEKTTEWGIKWDIKEFDTTLQIPEDFVEITKTYEDYKEDFEEGPIKHACILEPWMYMINDTRHNKQVFVDKMVLQERAAPYFAGDRKIFSFGSWIEDANRKEYRRMVFVPRVLNEEQQYLNGNLGIIQDKVDHDEFNTAHHYQASYLAEEQPEMPFNQFKQYLQDNILGYQPQYLEYMINWLAMKLKQPNRLLNTALLIQGEKGCGKDNLCKIFAKWIGDDYFYNQEDTTYVLGNVNTALKNKLFVVMNELHSQTGFKQEQKLKDLITREYNHIKELYQNPYNQKNCVSVICLTNEKVIPIKLTADNRRWIVFESPNKHVGEKDYWNEFYKNKLNNKEWTDSVFTALINHKIPENWAPDSIDCQPRDDKYYQMVNDNVNPIWKYLYNADFAAEFAGPLPAGKHKDFYYIGLQDFKKNFNRYTGDETKWKTQSLPKLCQELPTTCHKAGIKLRFANGTTKSNQLLFNREALEEYLKTKYFSKINDDDDSDIIPVLLDSVLEDSEDGDFANPLDNNIER